MLTPSEIAAAGDQSAERAAAAIDGIIELLARMAAEAVAAGTVAMGATGVPAAVLAYLAAHPVESPAEVGREDERAVERSDRNDASALGVTVAALGAAVAAPGAAMPTGWRDERPGTGAEFIEREVRAFTRRANLNMAADAQRTYRRVVAEGIRRFEAGMENYEGAMQRICREMARAGVSAVDYRSGRREQADVAVRRHVQTMVRKAADERTLDACGRLGVRLVEVSSHVGARPSHARWQGKVYSLDGDVTIGGVRYRDFRTATGYGEVDGLGGVNCRHSFAPYIPGRPRRWDEDAGDPEQYKLEQRQRANEREIRAWKREAMACRAAGVDDTDARLGLGRAQRKQREFLAEHPELTRRPGREQVHGADGETVRVTPLSREPDIQVGRSLGAKYKGDEVKLPDGSYTNLTEGTRITGIVSIAGKGNGDRIDEIDGLIERFGGNRSEWSKRRGTGYVDDLGMSRRCELHWYEEPSVGRVKMKVKKFFY